VHIGFAVERKKAYFFKKNRGTSDKIEARGLEYLLKVQSLMKQILIKNGFETLFIDASKSIELISKEIENFINFK